MKTIVLVLFCTFTIAAATAKRPVARRNVKTASAKGSAGSRSTKGKRRGKARASAAAPAQHPGQMAPSPERYQQIQQALVAKGYLKSTPTGAWDADSVEALRQFQSANQLEPTGKITAASLIGLGLGPSTAGAAFAGVPAVPQQQAPGTRQIGPDDLPPQPDTLPSPALAPIAVRPPPLVL
jgi:hypothetical protein